jgi:Tol biopolymer transport system component
VACGVQIVAGSSSGANFPGRNGHLAVVTLPTDINGPGALWSGLPDGSGGVQLSSDGGRYCCPSYSASGERMVLARELHSGAGDFELWIMNADGSGEHQLTSLGGPAFPGGFSSSEPRVAFTFTAYDGGPGDIYTVRLDGSGLRRLTATPNWADWDPVYSLGGHRLIWFRGPINFNVSCERENPDRCTQLWTMRSDGTHKRLLAEVVGGGADIDWGPGGDRIAYMHSSASGSILSIFRTDGTRVRNIPRPRAYGSIAWSPNGQWIAYTYFSRATGDGVRVVSVDGTQTRDIPKFWGDAEFLGVGIGWQPIPT